MGLCWEELGAKNQFRLGKLHYAKSKHYSCHRDEDLQQQQFPCPSWCIKYLTRSRVMLPQCHVFWRVWWLSWHCWCKILNLRPLPSFPYLFPKICWKDFCVPRGGDSDSRQSPQKLFNPGNISSTACWNLRGGREMTQKWCLGVGYPEHNPSAWIIQYLYWYRH